MFGVLNELIHHAAGVHIERAAIVTATHSNGAVKSINQPTSHGSRIPRERCPFLPVEHLPTKKRKAATDALLHQVVATFSSYRDTLGKHVLPPGDLVPANELRPEVGETFVWIKVKDTTRSYGKWMIGLELLALLAVVDWEVWIQQVKMTWPSSPWEPWYPKPSRVGVEIDVHFQGRFEPAFGWLGTTSEMQAQPSEVAEARSLVHKILQRRGEVVTHIPVRLNCNPRRSHSMSFFHAAQFVLTERHFSDTGEGFHTPIKTTSGAHSYFGLKIQYITIRVPPWRVDRDTRLNAAALKFIAMIADAGVAFHNVGVLCDEIENHVQHRLLQLMWKLFAIGETDADTCCRSPQEVAVVLSHPQRIIEATLSSFPASGSLRAATVIQGEDPSREQRQSAWKWIAYGLFTGVSRRQPVKKVTLDVGNFDDDDFQQITQVVAAKDPIAALLGRKSTLEMVTVSASRFRLKDPTKKGSVETTGIVCDNVLTGLPVLKRSKVWTQVLLPGWGDAWVHRDDVTATQKGASGPFEIQAIPHVVLANLISTSTSTVMDLLRLIGPGIRTLAFHGAPNPYPSSVFNIDGWSNTIFDACPGLVSLELKAIQIDSLHFVLDSYASGKCRLSMLKIIERTSTSMDDSVDRLVRALSDRRHPATCCLREFVIYPVEKELILSHAIPEDAVATLIENKQLTVFDVRTAPSYERDDELDECSQTFKAFDGELVSRPLAPLDIRHRLAFLSVLRPRDGSRRTRLTTRE